MNGVDDFDLEESENIEIDMLRVSLRTLGREAEVRENVVRSLTAEVLELKRALKTANETIEALEGNPNIAHKASSTGISCGEVDNHGELELVLTLDNYTGSCYLSREMWEAIAETAGWKKE